ncbi:squalene synthase HpnC [Andreprevotia lacus DSM 23236]|jgi:squalene synthase HpnC|uniref:Squalene synthase HpnC n=1 Tax=Andreprevotia lacus DSM 23236 TaxID=1121001 RepID=A0A1W1WZ69_9NEIS|nr:squalene synthase HpnC [Andreprevotia lacus]SMC17009.1 squalene synthase HpnC [Andreprevotia lacus DSM 23236]
MPALSAQQSVAHYENFPVGSLLLPRRLRKPVASLYHFARHADDLADEGDATPAERLAALAECRAELARIAAGEPPLTPRYQALANTVAAYKVPLSLCGDLLTAFEQDVVKARYADFGEVVQYCRHSANPVGRFMLHLFGATDARNMAMSDGICTALQLINFWQDVAVDWQKDRVYLPQDELAKYGVSEAQIAEGRADIHWQRLMAFQVDRTRRMLKAGAPLANLLPGRIGLELRLTVLGGATILDQLEARQYDMFKHRPKLTASDWPRLLWRALRKR